MKKIIIASIIMLMSAPMFSQQFFRLTYRIEKGKEYIMVPIDTKQPAQTVKILLADKEYEDYSIQVADKHIESWIYFNTSKYYGYEFCLGFTEDVEGMFKAYRSDKPVGKEFKWEKDKPAQ